jgi:hypothetical protein
MKNISKLIFSLLSIFCPLYAKMPSLNPLTQRVGLITKMVDKITGDSFTIRDYKFVQCGLKATGYAASSMLHMGTEKQKDFQKLEQQAIEQAVSWETSKPWYNPALKIDLYNPLHLLALSLTAYASCRVVETQVVVPGYKKLYSTFKKP